MPKDGPNTRKRAKKLDETAAQPPPKRGRCLDWASYPPLGLYTTRASQQSSTAHTEPEDEGAHHSASARAQKQTERSRVGSNRKRKKKRRDTAESDTDGLGAKRTRRQNGSAGATTSLCVPGRLRSILTHVRSRASPHPPPAAAAEPAAPNADARSLRSAARALRSAASDTLSSLTAQPPTSLSSTSALRQSAPLPAAPSLSPTRQRHSSSTSAPSSPTRPRRAPASSLSPTRQRRSSSTSAPSSPTRKPTTFFSPPLIGTTHTRRSSTPVLTSASASTRTPTSTTATRPPSPPFPRMLSSTRLAPCPPPSPPRHSQPRTHQNSDSTPPTLFLNTVAPKRKNGKKRDSKSRDRKKGKKKTHKKLVVKTNGTTGVAVGLAVGVGGPGRLRTESYGSLLKAQARRAGAKSKTSQLFLPHGLYAASTYVPPVSGSKNRKRDLAKARKQARATCASQSLSVSESTSPAATPELASASSSPPHPQPEPAPLPAPPPRRLFPFPVDSQLALVDTQTDFLLPRNLFTEWAAEQELDRLHRTGGDASAPAPFIFLKRNVYLHRAPRVVTRENADICMCDPATGDCGDTCLNRMMMCECIRQFCPCGARCTNQRFQKRQYIKHRVVRAGDRGWGFVAAQAVPKDTFIIEYVGEVINAKMLQQRLAMYKGDRHCYLLTMSALEYVDASRRGNNSRFINHSCSPNIATQKWNVCGETRVGLFALRDIQANEELVFDYCFDNYGKKLGCLCNAPNCRGFLEPRPPLRPEEPEERRRRKESTRRLQANQPVGKGLTILDCLWPSLERDMFPRVRASHLLLPRNILRVQDPTTGKRGLPPARPPRRNEPLNIPRLVALRAEREATARTQILPAISPCGAVPPQ